MTVAFRLPCNVTWLMVTKSGWNLCNRSFLLFILHANVEPVKEALLKIAMEEPISLQRLIFSHTHMLENFAHMHDWVRLRALHSTYKPGHTCLKSLYVTSFLPSRRYCSFTHAWWRYSHLQWISCRPLWKSLFKPMGMKLAQGTKR